MEKQRPNIEQVFNYLIGNEFQMIIDIKYDVLMNIMDVGKAEDEWRNEEDVTHLLQEIVLKEECKDDPRSRVIIITLREIINRLIIGNLIIKK